MKICAYCGRENEDTALLCAGCGTNEFQSTAAVSPPSMDSQKEWVTLVTTPNLAEADAVAGQLQAEGLEVFLPDQFLLQNTGIGATYGFVRVQVARENLADAKALLATPMPPPPPPLIPGR